MISAETENRLSSLLVAIADQEREVEIIRQVLCEQPLFETYTAFQRIDRNRKGYITTRDIYKLIAPNCSLITEKQIAMIVRFHDTSHEGKLTYTDFLDLVLPKNSSQLRAQACQRPIQEVRSQDSLTFDIEYSLCRLIEKEGNTMKEIEKIKERLTTRFDFNGTEAFKCIDRDNKKYISGSDIAKFLTKTGYLDNRDGIEFLFNRLDQNRDGFLSYSEFSWAFTPMDLSTKTIPNYATPTSNSLKHIDKRHSTSINKPESKPSQLNKSFTKANCSAMSRYKTSSIQAKKPIPRSLSKSISHSYYSKPAINSKVTPFSVYS